MGKIEFEKIVTHLQTTGYIFQGSQIYGGLSNSWDYGPLGSELKQNIKNIWWKKFVHESPTNVGIDSAILMNPKVWEATGHVSTFNDPLIDCKHCHNRYRADDLINEQYKDVDTNAMTIEDMNNFIHSHPLKCPYCGKNDFTDIRQFNMMFKTHIGVTEDNKSVVYLRPETAQGVFVNFKNVQRATRRKLPLGIANMGKSFRNEITPGNFIFRVREFEQMELEFFCKPGTDLEYFNYWRNFCFNFVLSLGIKKENLRLRDHEKEELAFYSKATTDIEYNFPFGWGEVWGIADRTDYDLKRHMQYSGESLEYLDPDTHEKYIPYCIEPSLGLERMFLMVVCDSYDEETLENGDTRKVMHLPGFLAPYKAAILPLSKQLNEKAKEVFNSLIPYINVSYDETGSIGKRYRRNDEIGTPYCITIDFDTLNDNSVTIRERDSMKQIRLEISKLKDFLEEHTFYR
ncbi:MAG: glycine--tRNA ligase [Firmicutes bacterium]|uniref:Glycine--tRNA ligase n=1 Tax=Candidatus Onthovivens merdipullorum TaxID=2840889 RepID=A0A9D9DKK5_9BACL|nr:glycine--tRNA ligase [Candidatus Onthovivens merdipullorum]